MGQTCDQEPLKHSVIGAFGVRISLFSLLMYILATTVVVSFTSLLNLTTSDLHRAIMLATTAHSSTSENDECW